MSFSLRSLAAGLVLVSASLLSGCGGGSGKPAPGMGCALNSDCAVGLICTFGLCHGACVPNAANGDCPTGELCVKSNGTVDGGGSLNVCQLPAELKCVYNSDCTAPLICARDEQCRNQCQTDVDCVPGQVCTDSKVCALTSQLVQGTNDVKVVTSGLDGGAGATGSGGSGGSGTGGAATGTGGAVSTGTGGAAGGAGATGLAGSTGKGGATGTGGTAGASGSCSPACPLGAQCVAGACQTCGTSGDICCGTGSTATCQSNLTCVSGTCTCGGVNQACCTGTTCSTGLQCVAGVCSCGGAGQNCCAGKMCNTGLVCGGLRCGCATACDESAVLKTDGSVFISNTPITNLDDTLFKVTTVSYNGTFGCGVKADGTVWCWGNNSYGELGIGDLTVSSSTPPVEVVTAAGGTALSGITSVGVSDTGYTACAIGASGAVWCWGYGAYGQLGNGFKNNSSYATPVLVDSSAAQFSGAQTISLSYEHACVYKTDKTVWCWGDNTYGEVGVGSTATTILYPTQVTNLQTSALDVIASDEPYGNSCAATADGSAYCWGGNSYDSLGNGLMSGMAIVPTQVLTAAATPLTMVTRVINWISGYKLCAQRSDLSVWCWGGGSATGVFATPLVDAQSNPVSGETVIGRECYLDVNDKLWVAGSMSGNQVTCP
jgi:hypothetical protein